MALTSGETTRAWCICYRVAPHPGSAAPSTPDQSARSVATNAVPFAVLRVCCPLIGAVAAST